MRRDGVNTIAGNSHIEGGLTMTTFLEQCKQDIVEIAHWHGGDNGPVHWVARMERYRKLVAWAEAQSTAADLDKPTTVVAGEAEATPPILLDITTTAGESLSPTDVVKTESGSDENSRLDDTLLVGFEKATQLATDESTPAGSGITASDLTSAVDAVTSADPTAVGDDQQPRTSKRTKTK